MVLLAPCYNQALLIYLLLEVALQDGVTTLEHMSISSSRSLAYIRSELLSLQKRLMSNGLNSKESLDKEEAVERILAAGNSSRSGFTRDMLTCLANFLCVPSLVFATVNVRVTDMSFIVCRAYLSCLHMLFCCMLICKAFRCLMVD